MWSRRSSIEEVRTPKPYHQKSLKNNLFNLQTTSKQPFSHRITTFFSTLFQPPSNMHTIIADPPQLLRRSRPTTPTSANLQTTSKHNALSTLFHDLQTHSKPSTMTHTLSRPSQSTQRPLSPRSRGQNNQSNNLCYLFFTHTSPDTSHRCYSIYNCSSPPRYQQSQMKCTNSTIHFIIYTIYST